MHKDNKVALCKDDIIVKILNQQLLPFGAIKTQEDENHYDISNWLSKRKIPEKRNGRKQLEEVFSKYNKNIDDTVNLNYGLSLTDNYWFYPMKHPYPIILLFLKFDKYDDKLPKYKDINYFDNDIERGFVAKTLYKIEPEEKDLLTPDLTTNGRNVKYWAQRNDKKYLVKQNDPIHNFIAEKELIASFICYLINECRRENKKKIIDTAVYQFEKGPTVDYNCCFSEIFTNKELDLVNYDDLTDGKSFETEVEKMEYVVKKYSENMTSLKEYFDFLIILDFITENKRETTDIALLYNNQYNNFVKPAPIYGNCQSFKYMIKDFTRANHNLYSSSYVNFLNMDEAEQCDYIAREIKWFLPEMLFRKSDLILDYLGSEDMSAIPLQYRENMADWIKYKIVLLVNRRKQLAVQEEMDKEDKKTTTDERRNEYDY